MGEKDENVILNDPYDGIFYNIDDTDDKTTIQFVSVLLFRLLLSKMQSDFQLPTDVHVYRLNTRKQKVKCHIVLNDITNSIEVSEAGHRAWKCEYLNKTMPSLMTQLVEKTNEGIDLCDKVDKTQHTQLVNEDVTIVELQEGDQNSKTVTQSNGANEVIMNQLTELKAQIQQIRKEHSQSKHSYAAVASTGPKASAAPASSSSDINIASSIQRGTIPRNQTNAENGKAKSAKGNPAGSSVGKSIPTIRKNTLLVGDSIINRVNTKGLKYNVHKHAIAGATIQTLMNEVQLFDLSKFDTIIAYVGGMTLRITRMLCLLRNTMTSLLLS